MILLTKSLLPRDLLQSVIESLHLHPTLLIQLYLLINLPPTALTHSNLLTLKNHLLLTYHPLTMINLYFHFLPPKYFIGI